MVASGKETLCLSVSPSAAYQTNLRGGRRGSVESAHSVGDTEQVKAEGRKSPGKSLRPVAGLSELEAEVSLLYTALGAGSVRLEAGESQFHYISEHRHQETLAPGWSQ